jgi:glucose/arabinose dehydrogenase
VWAGVGNAALTLPTNFVRDDVVPGVTFDTPTGIAFMPDGRMLVAEKRGRVWLVKNGIRHPTPLWSSENEVLNANDRGLLGVAVDPNYTANRYVYFLYTVDPDSNGTDDNNDAFGRLARYQVSAADSNVLAAGSRTILLGVDWRHGPASGSPSHTIGSLRFGTDGSLLVSAGEGAQFSMTDAGGNDAGLFGATKTDPIENVGAFRAQYIGSLAGKILRINPANGHGYASNPYVNGDLTSVRSRVWAYGLRNPFRFAVRPGSGVADTSLGQPGTLYIGDVGWNAYEEIDVAAQPGKNFGWPCYEGPVTVSSYQSATPTHSGCGTMGTPANPATATPPSAYWHHGQGVLGSPPGFTGNTSVGGTFYTGTSYPAVYRNQYFFADYGTDWIKVAIVDSTNQVQQVMDFASDADGPVDLQIDPVTGDVFYAAIITGRIHRLRSTTGSSNAPPVADAAGAPLAGAAPLAVSFSSAGSFDPDFDPIQASWNFGDATGSTLASPSHTYTAPGTYVAVLTVSDNRGGQSSDSLSVNVAASMGFPSTAVLDSFNRANGAVGGSWVDEIAGLTINANKLALTSSSASTVWSGGTFGADQEAFVSLDAITSAGSSEHDLMLKVQGQSWSTGHIEVRYDKGGARIQINTYAPSQSWIQRGVIPSVTLSPGDRLGARAYANGTIEVYRNGLVIGSASVGNWPYASLGGRIGLTLGNAAASRLDNFGGGTFILNPNTKPTATILSPPNGLFYVAGDTIHLHGQGSDTQDPPATLLYHWQENVHHNNHVHPSSFVSDSQNTFTVAENHDDGTGISLEFQLHGTDSGGLKDTASVTIHPEIDLTPATLTTVPSTPGTNAPAEYRFRIHNLGRMPAPVSHWRLVADSTMLAEGDTLVMPLDSVTVTRVLPPLLVAGVHSLRVRVDTLDAVVETNEANNAVTRELTVVEGLGPDEIPPTFTAWPTLEHTESSATIRWSSGEPVTNRLRFGRTRAVSDTTILVQEFAPDAIVDVDPLLTETLYYFQAVIHDQAGNIAVAPLDSFTTSPGVTGVGDHPFGTLSLSGAMPNPSRGSVTLALSLPDQSRVSFAVYDLLGREVWRAAPRDYEPGRWTLRWPGATRHGERARTGVYFARVTVNGVALTRRLAIIR